MKQRSIYIGAAMHDLKPAYNASEPQYIITSRSCPGTRSVTHHIGTIVAREHDLKDTRIYRS